MHCYRFAAQLEAVLASEGVKGFDIALDAVSGEFFTAGFNALAPGGRYVIYGASNWTPSGSPCQLLQAPRSNDQNLP